MYNLLLVTRTIKGPPTLSTSVSSHQSYEAAEREFKAVEHAVVSSECAIYEVQPIRLYKKV